MATNFEMPVTGEPKRGLPDPAGSEAGSIAANFFNDSGGEQALLSGDVAHHPCQMAHLDWCSVVDTDIVQSAASRHKVFSRFADTPTLVIGGHFSAGHIKRDGDAFKFEALQS